MCYIFDLHNNFFKHDICLYYICSSTNIKNNSYCFYLLQNQIYQLLVKLELFFHYNLQFALLFVSIKDIFHDTFDKRTCNTVRVAILSRYFVEVKKKYTQLTRKRAVLYISKMRLWSGSGPIRSPIKRTASHKCSRRNFGVVRAVSRICHVYRLRAVYSARFHRDTVRRTNESYRFPPRFWSGRTTLSK